MLHEMSGCGLDRGSLDLRAEIRGLWVQVPNVREPEHRYER